MGENLDRVSENLQKIESLSKRLVAALAEKSPGDVGLEGPGQDLYLKASTAYWSDMMTNPTKLIETQVEYWGKTMAQFIEMQNAMAQGQFTLPENGEAPRDKRFANPLWRTHPYFAFVRQQYELGAKAIEDALADLDGLEPRDKQRVEFFARQVIDLFSPTNYLATNPDALERAVETEGASLVQGLENLVRDIEARRGDLLPTLADPEAFKVGENLGVSEGSVVFRNRMMEVIQYAPKTETVHRTPLVIFPPWINKFYILDLKPQNSLIKWIVEQGFTLFVVSWKNPDETYADAGLDTYIEEGYLEAIRVAKEITGESQVNAVGYCVAGTTLALTLSLLKKRGDKSIKSATFFTTLVDFSEQGEFTVFLQDDFVDAIERQVDASGYLDSYYMSKTFSFLRAQDLVYQPAIRSYMMGESPPAFDLLFWNGDSTNLPGKMTVQYLRGLCQANALTHDGFDLLGETLSVKDVTVPVCAVACETDHIAAWKDSYRGFQQLGSKNKTFILSESGHIAGIINPPSKKKYGHYTNDDPSLSPEEWQSTGDYHEGSWWPRWGKWLASRSGKQVAARVPGEGGYKVLAPAPGTYVLEKVNG
ncbi:class I poly(R)-hydroxyalkanoic acid synthase [Roseibacterium beibuensis]|uniref:Class I poly(R)-hydroxyalkanoic acid synthase n=1 Tax=[Roseibacterium] beibuensis TaxID=1193142 RepID=A0ABP9L683_9RHOB|nr:class I poly(R)-hydroxyalkanoic acid synthase [Roseibacterium beibuensis]MCS6624037.1 class I poly(R)-hydroxyalkanoic acid synthase [Roseibacterium beibuensis]